MSQAEEMVMAAAEGDGVTEPVAEPHIVVGPDRRITVPEQLKRIAVQYDHNVETVTFDCPRYCDSGALDGEKLDMADDEICRIYINYKSGSGPAQEYPVEKIWVDDPDDNVMHFEWTISRNVTQVAGKVPFLVCVKKTGDTAADVANHWNSEINTDLYVSEGMETKESEEEIFESDIVVQLLNASKTAVEAAERAEAAADEAVADVEEAISGLTKNVDDAITKADTDVNAAISDLATRVDAAITKADTDVNTAISDLATSVDEAVADVASQFNTKVEEATAYIDEQIGYVDAVAENVDEGEATVLEFASRVDDIEYNINSHSQDISELTSRFDNVVSEMSSKVMDVGERYDFPTGTVTGNSITTDGEDDYAEGDKITLKYGKIISNGALCRLVMAISFDFSASHANTYCVRMCSTFDMDIPASLLESNEETLAPSHAVYYGNGSRAHLSLYSEGNSDQGFATYLDLVLSINDGDWVANDLVFDFIYFPKEDPATNYYSELTDIRVGADGTTYDTAGTAVRKQFKAVDEEIDILRSDVSNAFKGTARGEVIRVDDVCPVEHKVNVKVTSDTNPLGITLTRCGKNLIRYPYGEDTRTENGVTFTVNDDGSVTANGTATSAANYMCAWYPQLIPLPAGTYTLSGCPSNGGPYTYELAIGWRADQLGTRQLYYEQGKGLTMTFEVDGYVDIVCIVRGGMTATNVTFKPQLELGTAATDYEPYNGRTYTSTEDDTVLGVRSVAPTMTLFTDTPGAVIDIEYSRDVNKLPIGKTYRHDIHICGAENTLCDIYLTVVNDDSRNYSASRPLTINNFGFIPERVTPATGSYDDGYEQSIVCNISRSGDRLLVNTFGAEGIDTLYVFIEDLVYIEDTVTEIGGIIPDGDGRRY